MFTEKAINCIPDQKKLNFINFAIQRGGYSDATRAKNPRQISDGATLYSILYKEVGLLEFLAEKNVIRALLYCGTPEEKAKLQSWANSQNFGHYALFWEDRQESLYFIVNVLENLASEFVSHRSVFLLGTRTDYSRTTSITFSPLYWADTEMIILQGQQPGLSEKRRPLHTLSPATKRPFVS